MPRFLSVRPLYFLLVVSLGLLAGCQTMESNPLRHIYGDGTEVKESKDLLDGDGDMVIVEDKDALSPMEQHLKARGDVDPTKINKKNRYTTNVKDSHAKDKEHFRVVRVEGEAEAFADDEDVIIPPRKKTQTQSYIASILSRHEPAQSFDDGEKRTASVKKQERVLFQPTRIDARVKDVRIGQHPGKVRVVLDVDARTKFSTSFKNGNKVLVVSLPNTAWAAQAQARTPDKRLISGYDAREHAGGVDVEIALSAPGKLIYQKAMKPSGARGHRIVLDIVSR